jgi:hypothetical protein
MKAWLFSTLGSSVFAVGVAIGALGLYLAPGFGLKAVNAQLVKAQGAAAAQEARGDQSEENRVIEDQAAIEAVEIGRDECEGRVSGREIILERRLAICLAEDEEAQSDESCSCADYGPLRSYSDWMRQPELDDGGPGGAGAPQP